MEQAYDPLSYENLAKSVVGALMEGELEPLPPAASFAGPGVYAIYYTGSFPAYEPVALSECKRPIYVGKAVPPGARKGGDSGSPDAKPLFRRLNDHAKSVRAVGNLALEDFRCRYLVVMPVWITLAERFLISHYRPIWNTVIDGFGNHDPGKGRRGMRRPRWDIMHPGRSWAERLDPAETADDVRAALAEVFSGGPCNDDGQAWP